MVIAHYLLPIVSLGIVAVSPLSLADGRQGQPVLAAESRLTFGPTALAQTNNSRRADCERLGQFLNQATDGFTTIANANNTSPQQALAQIDRMIDLLNGYISRLQQMPLTEPQVRQFRNRYLSAFQEVRQFAQTVRSASRQNNSQAVEQELTNFLQKLEAYQTLDSSFQQYCGLAMATGSPTSRRPQATRRSTPSTQRPMSVAQRNTQTRQLNTQLRAAVEAKNWRQAIQIVDRLMVLHPNRASELRQYRARLVQLLNAQ
ncbi:MAG: hypothetical protein NZ772_14470 [Cyanobacteria bacterium]|nr:hypothetical protein [Cyanobacteriota bacterium]MDW8202567.1 hypothetical protein [Cyanobacteriota bacterium SKYGB_h_bin112]